VAIWCGEGLEEGRRDVGVGGGDSSERSADAGAHWSRRLTGQESEGASAKRRI